MGAQHVPNRSHIEPPKKAQDGRRMVQNGPNKSQESSLSRMTDRHGACRNKRVEIDRRFDHHQKKGFIPPWGLDPKVGKRTNGNVSEGETIV